MTYHANKQHTDTVNNISHEQTTQQTTHSNSQRDM